MKKVLHMASWYPNKWDNLEGIFIKEQFKVFSEVTDGYLINVQVREGKKLIEYKHIQYSEREEGYYILTKLKSNKLIEFISTILLLSVLIKSNYKKYDVLHFHIAYPLLIHYFIWKKIIKIPVIISEHWSAYHFNFYMQKDSKKLNGIKKIFKQKIPLITVSKSLLEDIQKFSGSYDFDYIVISNVIKQDVFYFQKAPQNSVPNFFIVNDWSEIKNPFPMLEAFTNLKIPFILKIGGFGVLYKKMKIFIKKNHMEDKVIIFGKMTSKEIAREINNSNAYLVSSTYETFSIVCAEALSCGCPLIGPSLSSILEYTNSDNSLFFKETNIDNWIEAIEHFINNQKRFHRISIAEKAKEKFSIRLIQNNYSKFLKKNIFK